MPNRKKTALVALLENDSVAAAAKASGISQPTLFRYLKNQEFLAQYREAKKSIVDAAITQLQKATGDAVRVLTELMNDKAVLASSRINAARAILTFAVQTTQIEEVLSRIEALEEKILR